jgi:hypothetical protein
VKNKILLLLVFACLFAACSSKVKTDFARKIIAEDTGIPQKQIVVKEVAKYPGTIVADAQLHLAFLLQQDKAGHWHVLKISKIPGKWEERDRVFPMTSLGRALESAILSELLK